MKRKGRILFLLSFLFLAILFMSVSYSKYISRIDGNAEATIAKWNISVNDCRITTNETLEDDDVCVVTKTDSEGNSYQTSFLITGDDVSYNDEDAHVVDGKIAPGSSGYFHIRIQPNDTDVSFSYQINLGDTKTEADITLAVIEDNGDGTTKTTEFSVDKAYEGVINLEDFTGNASYEKDIKIQVVWDAHLDETDEDKIENYNKNDTELGMSDELPTLDIPITIIFKQLDS